MSEKAYNELTSQIISACIEVHRELGPGLLESVYEVCLLSVPPCLCVSKFLEHRDTEAQSFRACP